MFVLVAASPSDAEVERGKVERVSIKQLLTAQIPLTARYFKEENSADADTMWTPIECHPFWTSLALRDHFLSQFDINVAADLVMYVLKHAMERADYTLVGTLTCWMVQSRIWSVTTIQPELDCSTFIHPEDEDRIVPDRSQSKQPQQPHLIDPSKTKVKTNAPLEQIMHIAYRHKMFENRVKEFLRCYTCSRMIGALQSILKGHFFRETQQSPPTIADVSNTGQNGQNGQNGQTGDDDVSSTRDKNGNTVLISLLSTDLSEYSVELYSPERLRAFAQHADVMYEEWTPEEDDYALVLLYNKQTRPGAVVYCHVKRDVKRDVKRP